mmetsp:Transcript_24408/g.56503  ORF Transcript_24408/g.56503 Transcript_24408/m.56503 type:complete len:251 (+) Transcript_24408:176-928(+)
MATPDASLAEPDALGVALAATSDAWCTATVVALEWKLARGDLGGAAACSEAACRAEKQLRAATERAKLLCTLCMGAEEQAAEAAAADLAPLPPRASLRSSATLGRAPAKSASDALLALKLLLLLLGVMLRFVAFPTDDSEEEGAIAACDRLEPTCPASAVSNALYAWSHTLTGLPESAQPSDACLLEHLAHTTLPVSRQWWWRKFASKRAPHAVHACASESGCQPDLSSQRVPAGSCARVEIKGACVAFK